MNDKKKNNGRKKSAHDIGLERPRMMYISELKRYGIVLLLKKHVRDPYKFFLRNASRFEKKKGKRTEDPR